MKKVNIFKAQKIYDGDVRSVDTMIVIDREFPNFQNLAFVETRSVFGKEAKVLFEALLDSLPGGTLSALFAEMCEHYRNLFITKYS